MLESDAFHHVLLPWPVDLEVPIQKAIQVASRRDMDRVRSLLPSGAYPRSSLMRAFMQCTNRRLPRIGKRRGRSASAAFWNFISQTLLICFADTCRRKSAPPIDDLWTPNDLTPSSATKQWISPVLTSSTRQQNRCRETNLGGSRERVVAQWPSQPCELPNQLTSSCTMKMMNRFPWRGFCL